MKAKNIKITMMDGKTITIPQPKKLKVEFPSPDNFRFRLELNEPKLRNLVSIMKIFRRGKVKGR